MAYWAKVVDNKVVKVKIADSDYFNTFVDDSPGDWIETFKDGSSRKMYAGVGMNYSSEGDVFYAPQPYASWTLDSNYDWQAPSAKPDDGEVYTWDEENTQWIVEPEASE
jgi:hypothetical protein